MMQSSTSTSDDRGTRAGHLRKVPAAPPASGLRQPVASTYDRISIAYDLIAGVLEGKCTRHGLDMLGARPGEHVLEIGSGAGRALQRLSGQTGSTGRVHGLDASAGMIRRARRRLSGCRARVRLLRGDGRALPYLDSSFDAVFMSFTLELFEPDDIARVLREVGRVIRRNGRFVVVCLGSRDRPGLLPRCYQWLHRRCPGVIDCRPIGVAGYLEASGFGATRVEDISLWGLCVTVVLAQAAGGHGGLEINCEHKLSWP